MSDDLLSYRPPPPGPPAPPAPAPAMVQYTPAGLTDPWRVELFALLAEEFALAGPDWAGQARQWHEIAHRYPKSWMVMRRLYGVMPVIPPRTGAPEDRQTATRKQLASQMGCKPAEIETEVAAVRGAWNRFRESEEKPAAVAPAPLTDSQGAIEFPEDILERHGFSASIFEVTTTVRDSAGESVVRRRPEAENRAEREWFSKRVYHCRKMLAEPMAETMCRQMLINELHLRRVGNEIASCMPGEADYRALESTKAKLETTLREQMADIDGRFPDLGGAEGRFAVRSLLSDVITARQEYMADGQTRRLDYIRTVLEIEVEMRQSAQDPTPRLRVGQSMFIIEAIHGLWDPNWKSELKPAQLARLDKIGKRVIEEFRASEGMALTDLEEDGPDGEYPDL